MKWRRLFSLLYILKIWRNYSVESSIVERSVQKRFLVPAEMKISNHQSKTARRAIKSTSGTSLLKRRKRKKKPGVDSKRKKKKKTENKSFGCKWSVWCIFPRNSQVSILFLASIFFAIIIKLKRNPARSLYVKRPPQQDDLLRNFL